MSGLNSKAPSVKGIKTEIKDNVIILDVSLLNYKIIIDIFLVGLAVFFNFRITDPTIYFIPLFVMYLGLAYMLWIDFKSINKVIINLVSKSITIHNKNPLSQIFIRKKTFPWNEIDSFQIRSNNSSKADFLRYYVDLKLTNSEIKVLASVANQKDAEEIADFLSSIIQ